MCARRRACVRAQVEAARSNDARLDAKEDAADEAERQEATRARRARQLAASSFKKELGETNRRRVDEIRDSTSHGLSRAMSARGRKKRSEAETTRTDFQKGRQVHYAPTTPPLRPHTIRPHRLPPAAVGVALSQLHFRKKAHLALLSARARAARAHNHHIRRFDASHAPSPPPPPLCH